ncbi:hypothetical protein IW261DRAFT_1564175 [Armillaria novae-zelandiae]|uniref:Uncharacterized protein n=1 Tax=Armillaria novae-zelandiae TaxID=153914 RepID=A0AA39P936_9AGAR|nr:hypothetical protein IW261DRAFT_1564175 [Armillaria novae-zelandiae]
MNSVTGAWAPIRLSESQARGSSLLRDIIIYERSPAITAQQFLLNQHLLSPLMTTACVHHSISMIQPKSPLSIPAASPLPQELIDIIIDYLYNDAHSLRACALVATSWLGRSQQNLFSRITLAGKLLPHNSKGLTLAELFSCLIESAPHIPTLVQHLVITESDAMLLRGRWLGRSISALNNMLPALTSLRTLHIDFSGTPWCDVPGIHTLFRSSFKLRDLRKVTISNFPRVPSWDRLFALFEGSNVTDICLVDVTTDDLVGDSWQIYVPESVRIPLETVSLSLESNELWRLSSWLANPSCILQPYVLRKLLLETLHIPSLQTIEIRLEGLDSPEANHLPDVSRFRHVRLTLTPEVLQCKWEGWISIAVWCWERLLKNFRENIIESVTLTLPAEVHPDKLPEAERMYWIALDAALTRADMTHLRRVYLEDESSQALGYRDGVIKDMFPNLYEKRLLVF